jgi:predicted Zn-dependent protease
MEGVRPTSNAIAALHYASDLAPQDKGLRMNSAVAYLRDGKLAEAKRALTPVAYDPHGGSLADVARAMIGRINSGDTKSALAATLDGAASESSSH